MSVTRVKCCAVVVIARHDFGHFRVVHVSFVRTRIELRKT